MNGSGGIWSVVVILGPILLGAVILWALIKSRKSSARDIERTERATHDLYKAEDAAHRGEDDRVA